MSTQTIIHSSPSPLPTLTEAPRMNPDRLRAIRAHSARIVMDRQAAGLAADGRILDMIKYAAHLRNRGTK